MNHVINTFEVVCFKVKNDRIRCHLHNSLSSTEFLIIRKIFD